MAVFTPTIVATTWFKTHWTSGVTWGATTTHIGAKFYTRTPMLAADPTFPTLTNLAELDALPQWVPVEAVTTFMADMATPLDARVRKVAKTGYTALQIVDSTGLPLTVDFPVMGWKFYPADPNDVVQEVLSAVVFYLVGSYAGATNPILFVTDQGIGDQVTVHGDAVYGQGTEEWIAALDTPTSNIIIPGATVLELPEPEWESAHAHHLWLEPQRVNLIVNPSFEHSTLTGWRAEDL